FFAQQANPTDLERSSGLETFHLEENRSSCGLSHRQRFEDWSLNVQTHISCTSRRNPSFA
ncbi:MAG: hypothetical protein V3V39_04825, partial [Desulfobacterales bacterium]